MRRRRFRRSRRVTDQPEPAFMVFTDIFIKRPILSLVVSMLILLIGFKAATSLPIRQYPKLSNTVVTVTTSYPGASPELMQGFITTPIEQAVASAEGVDYITSTSVQGTSTIQVYVRLNFDPNQALTEVLAKVNSVKYLIPKESNDPVITKSTGQTTAVMYIGFASDELGGSAISDYLTRVIQPILSTVDGVASADILGGQTFAMRLWLDPARMAGRGGTAADVAAAIQANNYQAAAGQTKGFFIVSNVTTNSDLSDVQSFKRMVEKSKNGGLVRMEDIATVELAAQSNDSSVAMNGQHAIFIGVQATPQGNPLTIVKGVRALFPEIERSLPPTLKMKVAYDSTKFIQSSIDEVEKTLGEAVMIVIVVIFLFLASLRSVIIPVVTIPLSLSGVCSLMLLAGFSINLLTLLAIVLAIGLVVDDAIVVVENIHRHLENGMSRMDAAVRAARELANPIIAMTIVLVAVSVPIGFMGGLTGALFSEFAFTLVGTVVMSAVIALTLSPMMCSCLLKAPNPQSRNWQDRLVLFLDRSFERLHARYERLLQGSLNYLPVTAVMSAIILGSIYYLYSTSMSELAPQEDQGVLISIAFNNPTATIDQRQLYASQIYDVIMGFPETDHVFQLNSPAQVIGGMVLKPWDARTQTATDLQPALQKKLSQIAGSQIAVFQPPPLPGARGVPIQFVITTSEAFDKLYAVSQQFLQAAQKTGQFIFLQSDLRLDLPQTRIEIDRNMAAQLGLNMQDIGSALSAMLGGGYVNFFELGGRAYKVIPQVDQRYRLNPDQLMHYYLRTASGNMVPLSTVVHFRTVVQPETISHFQQANAATIQGVALPFVAQGQALDSLKQLALRTLPAGYTFDYAGPSRQFVQESGGLVLTFFFALVIIFLALAAQFESFRDPIIILVSVPMAISGALLFINLGIGHATLNINTKEGLVTLIGQISKPGILIVEFANNLQREGQSKLDAITHAAGLRQRPILMTTAAIEIGVLPLLTASGAGAVSRFNMGLVIATGLSIGTLFTLFVVPAMYMMLGADHGGTSTRPEEPASPAV